MRDAANDLNGAQDLAGEDITEGRNSEQRPGQHCPMPSLRNIVLIVQDDQTLSNGAYKKRRGRDDCHPAEDRDPALDQTPECWRTAAFWCVQGRPAVLGADSGIDGRDLCHRGGD